MVGTAQRASLTGAQYDAAGSSTPMTHQPAGQLGRSCSPLTRSELIVIVAHEGNVIPHIGRILLAAHRLLVPIMIARPNNTGWVRRQNACPSNNEDWPSACQRWRYQASGTTPRFPWEVPAASAYWQLDAAAAHNASWRRQLGGLHLLRRCLFGCRPFPFRHEKAPARWGPRRGPC